ncbi:hypothetical protein G9274_000234 [Stenotrophomonas rhizophila]|nr:hypothetical protein G9274_000234 [Stenotrophomonas rhizophila]
MFQSLPLTHVAASELHVPFYARGILSSVTLMADINVSMGSGLDICTSNQIR